MDGRFGERYESLLFGRILSLGGGELFFRCRRSFRYFHIGEVLSFSKTSQEPIKLHPTNWCRCWVWCRNRDELECGNVRRCAYSDYNYSTTEGNATSGTLLMDISGTYQTSNLSDDRRPYVPHLL